MANKYWPWQTCARHPSKEKTGSFLPVWRKNCATCYFFTGVEVMSAGPLISSASMVV